MSSWHAGRSTYVAAALVFKRNMRDPRNRVAIKSSRYAEAGDSFPP